MNRRCPCSRTLYFKVNTKTASLMHPKWQVYTSRNVWKCAFYLSKTWNIAMPQQRVTTSKHRKDKRFNRIHSAQVTLKIWILYRQLSDNSHWCTCTWNRTDRLIDLIAHYKVLYNTVKHSFIPTAFSYLDDLRLEPTITLPQAIDYY